MPVQKPSIKRKLSKHPFFKKRCLIPADGWFEWQLIETQKYPHFHQSSQREAFAFAGIWVGDETTSTSSSIYFSILTRSAPPDLLHIHHRTPLILPQSDWPRWLDSENNDPSELFQILNCPHPEIEVYQVSSLVNSIRNDGPEIIRPELGKQSLLF